jgi:hypothetical protein
MVHSKKDANTTATVKPTAAQKQKIELTWEWCLGCPMSTESISDSRFRQIVGGHLEADPIADGQADEMPAHFAGNMGKYLVLIVQHHTEHGARQNRLNGSFQFNWLFGAHTALRYQPGLYPRQRLQRTQMRLHLFGMSQPIQNGRKHGLCRLVAQALIAPGQTFFRVRGNSSRSASVGRAGRCKASRNGADR